MNTKSIGHDRSECPHIDRVVGSSTGVNPNRIIGERSATNKAETLDEVVVVGKQNREAEDLPVEVIPRGQSNAQVIKEVDKNDQVRVRVEDLAVACTGQVSWIMVESYREQKLRKLRKHRRRD